MKSPFASHKTLIEQGYKITVLKPRRARKGELVMSMTKGVRTNTNRRGQAYSAHALRPETNIIAGSASAYYKTSGWVRAESSDFGGDVDPPFPLSEKAKQP